jgi:hypothetical protein
MHTHIHAEYTCRIIQHAAHHVTCRVIYCLYISCMSHSRPCPPHASRSGTVHRTFRGGPSGPQHAAARVARYYALVRYLLQNNGTPYLGACLSSCMLSYVPPPTQRCSAHSPPASMLAWRMYCAGVAARALRRPYLLQCRHVYRVLATYMCSSLYSVETYLPLSHD